MIKLNGVTKAFGDFKALDNMSLEIPKGTAFGLLGSNGAGKSTILRLVSGVYKQDSGSVTIDDQEIYDNVASKQRIFFINDETVQFSNYTLIQLKDFYKSYYPTFSEDDFLKLNNAINLPTDKKLNTFSKGMKRQAIVIIGLSCHVDYLLLDEAFDGLDPTMRIIVKKMIANAMLEREMTVIISSHNLNEINELCDMAALVHKGQLIFNRQLNNVRTNIHKIQVAFNNEQSITELAIRSTGIHILHIDQNHSVFHIIARADQETIENTFSALNPLILDILPLSLEEVFIYELEVLGYGSNILE